MTTDTTATVPTEGVPMNVPLVDIHPNPRQVRRDVGDVVGLAESIKNYGLLEPVVLIPIPDEDDLHGYYLVAGHRRVAAAVLAGLTAIPSVIHDGDAGSPGHQILGMLIENGQREPLSAIEEAKGLQEVLNLGETGLKSVAAIARVVGRPAATLRQRVALTKLPEDVQERVHARQVTLDQANALLDFAGDEATMTRLAKAAGTANFAYLLEEARRNAVRDKARAALREELEAKGLKVIDQPDSWGPIMPLGWLRTQGGNLMDAEEHAQSCPHHAVAISNHSTYALPVCLDPVAGGHRDPSNRQAGGQAAADTDYERRAAARTERLAIGRKLRAEHQTGMNARLPDVQLGVLRLYLRWAVPSYLEDRGGAGSWTSTTLGDIKELAAIFGVEVPVPPRPTARSEGTKAQMERDLAAARDTWSLFRPAIEQASAEQCVRAMLSMLRRDVEARLAVRDSDRRDACMAYLALLTDHGYELSDPEREDLGLQAAAFTDEDETGDVEPDTEPSDLGHALDEHGVDE